MLSNNKGYASQNIKIVQGSFRLEVPAGTENAVERINKLGATVNELAFNSLNGKITRFDIEDTKFGKQIKLCIQDDKDYYLSLGYADSLTVSIYKMLPNVDPSKGISLELSRKMGDDGKERTSIFIKQNGENVKWAYTKVNKNGLPDMVKIRVNGKEEWDKTAQLDFLQEKVIEPFMQKVKSVTVQAPVTSSVEAKIAPRGMDPTKMDIDKIPGPIMYENGEIDPADIPF